MNDQAIPDPELDALLGAFALDALDADEHDELEAYLATHPEAKLEISRFEDVLAALATADAADPPPELWDRVQANLRPADELQRIRAMGEEIGSSLRLLPDSDGAAAATGERGDPTTAPASVPARAPEAAPASLDRARAQRAGRRSITLRLRTVVLAAAAALAVLAGTVAVMARGGDDPGSLRELAAAAARAPGAEVATLSGARGDARVVIDADGNGYLVADGLEALPEGQTYQLWSLDGAAPVSLGVVGADPSVAAFPGGRVSQVALSIEPAGGSAAPTLPPVAAGEVHSA